MNEHHSPQFEADSKKALTPLVERLDPSIGELSTVLGAMMTELLRRTLRGSVGQIDEELQGQVAQKIDAAVAQRLPVIEQSAADAAEKTAREAATEVAAQQVQGLEQRTKEAERGMVSRIETTARAAEQQTAETARALTGKIELVEKKTELSISSKAQELNSHIEEAERRANETAQAEVTRQVEELVQRSRKTISVMKERIQNMDTASANLTKQLQQQAQERRAAEEKLREELTEARRWNEALAARVTELEKPRGLRALWAWLFGRKKTKPATKAAVADDEEMI